MENRTLPEMKSCPAVFAVSKEYQIMIPFNCETVLWITVGDKKYYDHTNGVLRSMTPVHKVCVPMKELDENREYTVFYRQVFDRKPYFPEVGETKSITYKFRPVEKNNDIRIYHIADTHGNSDYPAKAANCFDNDIVVINGDLQEYSKTEENLLYTFELCEAASKGEIPCVFARGNHDMRGRYAELQTEYAPSDKGNFYYTFRIGSVWGMVLDCGEDKTDSYEDYNGTICCHEFRREQTEFIKRVAADEKNEHGAEDVEYRIIVAHADFAYVQDYPFDIETDIYKEWVGLINKYIKPHFMLCGHEHFCAISEKGGKYNTLNLDCPVVIGSKPVKDENRTDTDYVGAELVLNHGSLDVLFTNSTGTAEYEEKLKIRK